MIARRRRKRLGMGNKNNGDKSKKSLVTTNKNGPKVETENLIEELPPDAPRALSVPKIKPTNTKSKTGGMNVTIMLLAVVFFFFICQFPNLIMHIITSMMCSSVNSNCSHNGLYQYSLAISKLLLICNLSFNFVIYCLFSEKFREVLFETFNCFNLKTKKPVLPNINIANLR